MNQTNVLSVWNQSIVNTVNTSETELSIFGRIRWSTQNMNHLEQKLWEKS